MYEVTFYCNNLLKNNTIIPTIDDIIVNKTISIIYKFIIRHNIDLDNYHEDLV